jgi:hypothetical protein
MSAAPHSREGRMRALEWRSIAGTYRHATHVTVVLACARCGKFHHVGVRLVSQGCDFTIPEICPCGEALRTPENDSDVENTAAMLFAQDGAA